MADVLFEFVHILEHSRDREFFEGDEVALPAALTITDSQKEEFDRYRIVPPAFYMYLMMTGIIGEDESILRSGSSIRELLNFLRCYPYENQSDRDAGQYLYDEILKGECPMITGSFASSHVWKRFENDGKVWRLSEMHKTPKFVLNR